MSKAFSDVPFRDPPLLCPLLEPFPNIVGELSMLASANTLFWDPS